MTTPLLPGFSMLEDPNYKFKWAAMTIRAAPYNLSPGLSKIMDKQIELLLHNGNSDIGMHLSNYLRKDATLEFLKITTDSSKWSKYLKLSTKKRASLCFFGRIFNWLCLSKLMSATNPEILRLNSCLPLGISCAEHRYCRHLFCPNCYMRKAAKTRKFIKENIDSVNPMGTRAIIVGWNCEAQENMYGFNFQEDPVNVTRRITTRLKDIKYTAIRTAGAHINARRPMSSSRMAIFLQDPSKEKEVLQTLISMKSAVFKKYCNVDMSISLEEGVDNIVYSLYDCPPICLAGVSGDDLRSSMLHHTVESFKHFMAGRKTICVFGTGVKIEQQDGTDEQA